MTDTSSILAIAAYDFYYYLAVVAWGEGLIITIPLMSSCSIVYIN